MVVRSCRRKTFDIYTTRTQLQHGVSVRRLACIHTAADKCFCCMSADPHVRSCAVLFCFVSFCFVLFQKSMLGLVIMAYQALNTFHYVYVHSTCMHSVCLSKYGF